MSSTSAILGIVPTMQATAIASSAYKAVPRMKPQKKPNYRKQTKRMVGAGVKAIVGTSLLIPTAQLIGGVK